MERRRTGWDAVWPPLVLVVLPTVGGCSTRCSTRAGEFLAGVGTVAALKALMHAGGEGPFYFGDDLPPGPDGYRLTPEDRRWIDSRR